MATVETTYAAEDLRVYQHGVDIVEKPNGDLLLVWSSAGNPPVDDWIHDIYTSPIDRANPVIRPTKLLGNDEAQEPASAAVNSAGHLMVTMEDGWNAQNEVAQRYGVYSASNLAPIRPYPQLILDGGHSGHVVAVGSRCVVFYSEGWVDGGGVDDLGSGDDVYAAILDSNGAIQSTTNVAVGDATRDWWPLVAGSPTHAAFVWQRFVDGALAANLMFALLDPVSGRLTSAPHILASGIKYYTYDVEYVSGLDRFLVLASYEGGGGVAYLLDESGAVAAKNTNIPSIVREGQPALRNDDSGATAVYPQSGGGVAILGLTRDSITLTGKQSDPYAWQYMGTAGVFLNDTTAYFASLSTKGVVQRTFTIDRPKAVTLPTSVTPAASKDQKQTVQLPLTPPTIAERIRLAATTSENAVVPSSAVERVCQSVLPPGRMPYTYYFVMPYRTLTPTAHLILASYCAHIEK